MKVVIHNAAAELRGSERQAILIATGLRGRGHEVLVSCDPGAPLHGAMRAAGVPTTAIRPRGDADPWNFARFVLWLRRERPDAILLTTWKRVPSAALAARLAGVPRVVSRLGITRRLPNQRRFRLAFRRWVDALVVNSPDVREHWLQSAPGFPREAVRVVVNGVEPRAPAAATLRAELGLPPEVRLVVSAGGLEHRKGFDLLLDAFAALGERPACLAIAGTGGDAEALRERAARLGLGGRVRFLGHRGDLPSVLASADLFVLASRRDSLANVMLEAMALNVPVLATDTGGVRLALGGEPPAGWIVPARDSAALADALARVLDAPPAELAARTVEARRRVDERFSVERMVDGYEAALFAPLPTREPPT